MTQYPITLHHPAYDPGKPARLAQPNDGSGLAVGTVIQNGTPCRYQPMTVTNAGEEEALRAKGYLPQGEARAPVEGYHEFPKMLVHPDHVDAIPDEIHAEPRIEGQPVKTHVVKGTPEKFPSVTANDAAEEASWRQKGYTEPVRSDPQAFERSRAMPYDPSRVTNGYPRWENGVLLNDPSLDTGGRQQYPKYVGDELVNNAAEEAALLEGTSEFPDARIEALLSERRAASERDDNAAVERIENLLSDHGIEVKDKPHGTVWRRLEQAEPTETKDPEGDPRAELLAEAERKGIKVDKRWNVAKLQEALAKAA